MQISFEIIILNVNGVLIANGENCNKLKKKKKKDNLINHIY